MADQAHPRENITAREVPFLIGLFLVPVSTGLAIDLIIPMLPAISDALSIAQGELTVSCYLLGFGLFASVQCLIARNVSFQKLTVLGTFLFLMFTLLATTASTPIAFLMLRFCQGAAAAIPSTAILVLIGTLYGERPAVLLFAVRATILGLLPVVAPPIGSALLSFSGWKAGFYLTAAISGLCVVVLFLSRGLIKRVNTDEVPLKEAFRSYFRLLLNRQFLLFAMTAAAVFSGLFAFIAVAPFILIESFQLSPETYGLYQSLAVSGYPLGMLFITFTSARLGSFQFVLIGLAFCFFGSSGFLAVTWFGLIGIWPEVLIPNILIYVFGLSLVLSGTPGLCFAFVPENSKAEAAALLVSIQFLGGALASQSIGAFGSQTLMPAAISMVIAAAFGGLFTRLASSKVGKEGGVEA